MDLVCALYRHMLLSLYEAFQIAGFVCVVVLADIVDYFWELFGIGVVGVILQVEFDLLYGFCKHELMLSAVWVLL